MARNHKFFFDADRTPRARGPAAEKTLMTFLETDVQGSDHVCHDLMDDLVAIEDGSDDQREFIGNAHRVTIDGDGVLIEPLENAPRDATAEAAASTAPHGTAAPEPSSTEPPTSPGPTSSDAAPDTATPAGSPAAGSYRTGRKHFREVLEDWEAFILDDGTDDLADDSLLDDEFA